MVLGKYYKFTAMNNRYSYLAEHIIGSEIIRIAAEINKKIREGSKIYNLTIGDFDPKLFPIPEKLRDFIVQAYVSDSTNYPPADGIPALREAVARLTAERQGMKYNADEILIACGARPVIYSIFRTLVDKDDNVLYAVPSWNNNHYTFLHFAKGIEIHTKPEHHFMPSADDILPHISDIQLLALCSPQNPTGTMFSEEGLKKICLAVLEENQKRTQNGKRPLYVMYDQIYSELVYGDNKHYNPVVLFPEMRDYTVFVDGISKSLAATGVRVGWGMGPKSMIDKMKSILTHIGAWAPRPEQEATANYLSNLDDYNAFLEKRKQEIFSRLTKIYEGFMDLKNKGFPVDCIEPQGAIYLTVRFNVKGYRTKEGKTLQSTEDITNYLLNEAHIGLVPFYAFGAPKESEWYRISVGTLKHENLPEIFKALENALRSLHAPTKAGV